MSQPDLQLLEDFLYYEAALLDQPDLDSWIKLFTADGTYWMPALENQPDPLNSISHFYDDRVMMEIRKRNFVHPRAASKDSNVRCSHILGNIRTATTEVADELLVTANFHVVMWYREEQRVYAGRYTYRLMEHGDSFLIRQKKVDLINPEAAQKSLIIYL